MQVQNKKPQVSHMQQEDHAATILCPMCGRLFQPILNNVCQACTLSKTDITIGITKEAIINFCRFCHRWMRPPWVLCDRDSKQLLAILLKKIRGLGKAKIINAGFIWTQIHSKRIKVKITIQKQLNEKTKIEQTFVTQFIEAHMQCDDCKKQFTPHTWGAVVQVRQHVNHKKTFFYIQQLILKHGAYDKVLKVSEQDDGVNFYYKNTTHAQRLIDFLALVLPLTVKNSKQLISHDESSNVFVYNYTFSVEIPRICRNDLVILPKKLAKQLGGCSRLVLCHKVAKSIGLIDLNNFNYFSINEMQYKHYQKQFQLISLSGYCRQFQILDSNPLETNKFRQVKSTLNKLVRKLSMYNVMRRGQWENVEVRGVLGEMKCGTLVQGFDLRELSHSEDFEEQAKNIQPIILVRRVRERGATGKKKRAFKLKKLQEQGVIIQQGQQVRSGNKKGTRKNKKNNSQQQNQEYQQFLDDIQADPTLRKQMNLYKNSQVLKKDMNKEELDELYGEMEVCELIDGLTIQQVKEEQLNKNVPDQQLEGIDDLISRMENVRIDKQ